MMDDRELDALLDEAPKVARLPWDPWPAIAEAMGARSRARRFRFLAAAIAVLCFGLGAATGALLSGTAESSPAAGLDGVDASSALLAAARVQVTGSEYVAAVGELQQMRLNNADDGVVTYAQGYEAALVALEAVVEAIRQAPVADTQMEELAGMTRRVRAAHSAAVSELLGAGSAP